MPLFGLREITPLLREAPLMAGLDTEPETLSGVEVLQVMFEIASNTMLDLLPRALHPTIPPTATFVFWRCPDGPLGPFTLAQVRVGCRAGVRPRGFLLQAYCDGASAAAALAARWGFACRLGTVRLHRYYDRIVGSVEADGRPILQVTLIDPQVIVGVEIQYTANMNLARVRDAQGERVRLVQVDPEYTLQRTDRGRPQLDVFEPEAWHAVGLRPVYPVSASAAVCDLTLPRIRYLVDPDVPALQGTEQVRR
ncbi:MAG: hypothetical protein C4290_02270 [Chloroflexota bacterium]